MRSAAGAAKSANQRSPASKRRPGAAGRWAGDRPGPWVAGIVASAGGLQAFQRFFDAMPETSGIAFVLIPHLDPGHESHMAALIGRHTAMPVEEARDGMKVQEDHVYVLAPNTYLTIERGALHAVTPIDRDVLQTSMDLFLRSLAEDREEKAIGIVLSGTGSHGSLGLKAVKSRGGLALVQDPETAEYPQMPEHAVDTGIADLVLPPERMPATLVEYVRRARESARVPAVEAETDELQQILGYLRARARFDFRAYRTRMIARRLDRRMRILGLESLGGYLAHLRKHPAEVGLLARELLVSVTNFFRDPEAYQALATQVLPQLIEDRDPDSPIRVWVAGCATGEEAYSLAMIIHESLAEQHKPCPVRVFATDASPEALAVARRGTYPDSIAADVSPDRIRRFFTRVDDTTLAVNNLLRESVTIAVQNVLADPPFSRVDLVSCRNLLIYLEPEAQEKLLTLLHFALSSDGYLFLGPSETVGRLTDLFHPVSRKGRIFRRVGPARIHRIPSSLAAQLDTPLMPVLAGHEPPRARFADLAHRALLAEYGRAAVLINQRNEVLYTVGPAARYLDLPVGEPTQDLTRQAKKGLRSALMAALGRSSREERSVTVLARLVRGDAVHAVQVTVKPVRGVRGAEGLRLVLFEDQGEGDARPSPAESVPEAPFHHDLEEELRSTRKDLQNTIEELESANEELRASHEEVTSMNEELQSANEERESSKEELQSLNEELATVNAQLEERVRDLEEANDDMANLLHSTDVGTLYLDAECRIRRFTPATTRVLNLIGSDIGRPLSDIALRFADPELLADAGRVLHDLTPREAEVRTDDGRWYLRRIVPYRTIGNRIEGVLLTFVDITRRREAEKATQRSEIRLRRTIRNAEVGICYSRPTGAIREYNDAFLHLIGWPRSEAEAEELNWFALIPPEYHDQARRSIAESARAGVPAADKKELIRRDGTRIPVLVSRSTTDPDGDEHVMFVADLSEVVRIQSELQARTEELKRLTGELEERVAARTAALSESQRRLQAIVASAGDAIVTLDRYGRIESVNPRAEEMFGGTAEELVGRSATEFLPSPYREEYENAIDRYLATGVKKYTGTTQELVGRRTDGSLFPVEATMSEIPGLGLFLVTARDISSRRELERQVLEISSLEQLRIGQQIHDNLGQELTGVSLMVATLGDRLRKAGEEEGELADRVQEGIERLQKLVRMLSHGLVPVEVEPEGLASALEELARRTSAATGVHCSVEAQPVTLPDRITATNLYYIAQEAVNNAVRHGGATRIQIIMENTSTGLAFCIDDDGRGLDEAAAGGGLGMTLMKNRATTIGARLTIGPADPHGTRVKVILPLPHRDA